MKHKIFAGSAILFMLSLCSAWALADTSASSSAAATGTCKALLVGMDYGSSKEKWFVNATELQKALLTWDCWTRGTIKVIGPKATARDITGNLSAMNIGPNDIFIFYYSGHATYWSGDERPPGLNIYDEGLYATNVPKGLTDNDLSAYLNKSNVSPTADKMVILDCCYSGGFWNGSEVSPRFGDLEKIPRIALLASTRENTSSPAGSDFTNWLVRGMTKSPPLTGKAPADANNDGAVKAKEWFDYAAGRVPTGPIYGYRKQTGEEPLENETTLTQQTWTYNDPKAVDTNGALDSAISFRVSVGGVQTRPNKLVLLAPYVGLASALPIATVAAAICIRRVKQRKDKR
jgi:hypothetical protein